MDPHQLLRDMRENAGLSLREASRRSGIDHSQLARIERGDVRLYTEYLDTLASIYGCRVDYVVTWPEDARPALTESQRATLASLHRVVPLLSDEAAVMLAAQADAMVLAGGARRSSERIGRQ